MREANKNPYVWASGYPVVYGHTSISFLKSCPGYNEAKSGSDEAAMSIAKICVKQNRIQELQERHPKAVLVPVISENKLPQALASVVGLEVDTGVCIRKAKNRKHLNAAERLLDKPGFTGLVKRGQVYILADDIVTQGGTLSALRRHIITLGGSVAAVVALAFSINSENLAPTHEDIERLYDKFGADEIHELLEEYGITDDVWELTGPQIRCLLRFRSLEKLKHKLLSNSIQYH